MIKKNTIKILILFVLFIIKNNIYTQDEVIKLDTNSNTNNIKFGISNKDTIKKSDRYFYDKEIEQVLSSKLPKEYIIADVIITGTASFDKSTLLSLANITIGQKITLPGGDQLSKAIQNLWAQHLFENIQIFIDKIENRSIYLEINVVEKPRLSNLIFKGISKSDQEELNAKIGNIKKRIISNQMKRNLNEIIQKYYYEKGFLNLQVKFNEYDDKKFQNFRILEANIIKGNKNKIRDIVFFGNENFNNYKLRSVFSETKVLPRLTLYKDQKNFYLGNLKQNKFSDFILNGDFLTPSKYLEYLDPYYRWNIFNGAKFNKEKYIEDKESLIEFYQTKGYRDIEIEKDTTYIDDFYQRLNIELKLKEGNKYYFGDISFTGNTKYSDSILHIVLGIKKGDVYNLEYLNSKLGKKLTPDGGGNDISSLYMDDGYLFFNVEVIETKIYNDTIDYILNIREGPQATIKKINISGNEKTRDYVVRRELRTLPGMKFSRSDLIRSQRELANLSFFNPEKIGINPVPNIEEGTVDINYTVEEKSSDQIELSAGYSGYIGLTGTLGLNFNNFSTRHIFDKSSWKPLPSGDGQKLSFRVQANGRTYYTASASFTEPWLFKKRRTSLTFSNSYTFYGRATNSLGLFDLNYVDSSNIKSFTSAISIGRQLKWPDDYFTLSIGLNYTLYQLTNYALANNFNNGYANNISLKFILSRNSIDQPLFTRSGSNISLMGQFTLPYSLFMTQQNPFQLVEYHKWRFNSEWYFPLTKGFGVDKNRQLVLKLAAKYGILGRYNSNLDYSPFERFQVGDAGLLNSFSFLGYDVIAQRGYYVYDNSNPKINPQQQTAAQRFTMFNKYQVELRYPITTNPSATIYVTTYFEAANGWYDIKEYNPLELRRSVGVGARFFLPQFGLLGFDYAVGVDRINTEGSINGAARFNFILGFEPD